MLAPQLNINAKTTTGWGTPIRVNNMRHAVLAVATSGLGIGQSIAVKVAHSYNDVAPDFTSAKSVTNPWAYVQCFDLEGGPAINGSDGLTISGVNDVKHLEVNQNSATWIAIEVATIDAGAVTVTVVLSEE